MAFGARRFDFELGAGTLGGVFPGGAGCWRGGGGIGGARRRAGRRARRVVGLSLERLESRRVPATVAWTGADVLATPPNDNWSDANNWQGETLPVAGDALAFPIVTGAALTSTNDLTAGTSYSSLSIQVSGYTIQGHGIALTGPLDAAQAAGIATVDLPVDFGAAAGMVTVGSSGAVLVLGGAVGGSGGLTKGGAGELDLTAANTLTGTTTVAAGVLHVDGSVGGAVAVSPGATLGGVGTVGAITTTGATLSPGDSTPGTLTDTGALTLDPSSTYQVTLDSDTVYSQTRVGGAINLGGATLSTSLGSGFVPTGKDQFTILKNTGAAPITGTFAGLDEGATLTIGGQPFRISYQGGAGHDVVLTHLVTTTTTLSPVTTAPVFGQRVALTATVTPQTAGLGTPTGSVDFLLGTIDLGSAPLNASGTATLDTTSLAVGANTITAVYSGDSTFATSTAPAITVPVGQAATTTTLRTGPNPSSAGQAVTLIAMVAAVRPGSGVPTGTVEFFNGTTDLGPGTLTGGVAALVTSSLPVGSDSITATYSGDSNFQASTAPAVIQTVSLGTVRVTVSTPTTNPFGLTPVPLTATVAVTSSPAAPAPTGTVTFYDITGTNLGSGTLTNGTATLTVPSLPLGRESITAVYSGDSNYGGATSPALPMVVGSRAELFVNQVFLDLFRTPAGYGEDYWVALLNGGYPPKLVARDIVDSPAATAVAVDNASETYLGRPATLAEVARVLSRRNPSLMALDAAILGSRAFYRTRGGGTIRGYLAALADAWFGIALAPRLQDRLAAQLKRGVPRRQVALEVITSPAGIRAEVNSLVQGILQRPADRQDVARFGPLVKRGQISQVAVDLFGSREFSQKFVNIT